MNGGIASREDSENLSVPIQMEQIDVGEVNDLSKQFQFQIIADADDPQMGDVHESWDVSNNILIFDIFDNLDGMVQIADLHAVLRKCKSRSGFRYLQHPTTIRQTPVGAVQGSVQWCCGCTWYNLFVWEHVADDMQMLVFKTNNIEFSSCQKNAESG